MSIAVIGGMIFIGVLLVVRVADHFIRKQHRTWYTFCVYSSVDPGTMRHMMLIDDDDARRYANKLLRARAPDYKCVCVKEGVTIFMLTI